MPGAQLGVRGSRTARAGRRFPLRRRRNSPVRDARPPQDQGAGAGGLLAAERESKRPCSSVAVAPTRARSSWSRSIWRTMRRTRRAACCARDAASSKGSTQARAMTLRSSSPLRESRATTLSRPYRCPGARRNPARHRRAEAKRSACSDLSGRRARSRGRRARRLGARARCVRRAATAARRRDSLRAGSRDERRAALGPPARSSARCERALGPSRSARRRLLAAR